MIRPNGRSVKIPIKLTTHEFIPKNAVEFTIE